MNFNTFLGELWNEPATKFTVGILVFAYLFYWILHALFETVDRHKVVVAAENWARNKERRNQREEARILWDSVNQLKRGQKEQRNGY